MALHTTHLSLNDPASGESRSSAVNGKDMARDEDRSRTRASDTRGQRREDSFVVRGGGPQHAPAITK
jgi:hypothetical protein